MMQDLIHNLSGTMKELDLQASEHQNKIITFLMEESLKVSLAITELKNVDRLIEAEDEDRLRTEFERMTQDSGNWSVSAKASIGPIGGKAGGRGSSSHQEQVKEMLDTFTRNKRVIHDVAQGTIRSVQALDVQQVEQFLDMQNLSRTISFSNFTVVKVRTPFAPFTLSTTVVPESFADTPIGSIHAFAGTAWPYNWKLCDGQSLQRANFPELFAIFGTTYGKDDENTFKLPDLRGMTPIGAKNINSLGKIGGSETHQLTEAEMPTHNHSGHTTTVDAGFTRVVHLAGPHYQNNCSTGWKPGPYTDVTDESMPFGKHTHSIPAAGGNQPHNIMQPFMMIHYIIRVL